jgi:hypothetical protein
MVANTLTPAASEPLRYHGLEISEDAVSEIDGSSVVRIAREEIRSISLCWGLTGERLPAQLVFGLFCLAIGGSCAVSFYHWITMGGVIPRMLPPAAVISILGIYVLRKALRRGYFLRVRTDREVRKLAFEVGADRDAIGEFLRTASRTYGYAIDREIG